MAAICHLGFVPVLTTLVFVTVQNLVGIDAVVSIICKFVCIRLEKRVLVDFTCYMGSSIHVTTKRHLRAYKRDQ